MGAPNYAQQGWVSRAVSAARRIVDGNPTDPTGPRFNSWQEQSAFMAMMGEAQLADEGSILIASMTPGQTALQLGLSAAFSAVAPALVIKNNAPAGSPIRLGLREIHFMCATPPTAGTGLLYATILDNVNRAPSTVANVASPATATAYLASVASPNFDNQPVATLPSVWFPLSAAAGAPPAVPAQGANAVVLVGNGNLRSVIPVGAATSGVQDDYRIVFGAQDRATGGALRSTAGASQIIEPHVAVTLGAQQFFLLYLWAPSNITAGFAFAGLDVAMFLR